MKYSFEAKVFILNVLSCIYNVEFICILFMSANHLLLYFSYMLKNVKPIPTQRKLAPLSNLSYTKTANTTIF